MPKTKVLYVITSLGIGGAERLLLSYLSRLDHSKYLFHVCSLWDKPDDLQNEISKYCEVTNLGSKNKFNLKIIVKLIKLFREFNPDLIHSHLFQARFYTTIAYLFYRRSTIITHKHNNVNPVKHNLFIVIEMLSILLNHRVIAISNSVKKSLIKYELIPSKKIFVLPNAVDFNKFFKKAESLSSSNSDPLIIGTICRLERQKGIKYLLLAMNSILAKFPNARLEIVGDGSLLQDLKQLSEKLGISNSVTFFGKFADVIPFYKRMNIFVLPSLYEGFGIVLLEAMAAGVPIVATNVEGIKEVVVDGECGILIPSKDPDSITNAVTQLIENPQLATQYVENGLKRASSFDITEHIMKIDKFYSTLLGVES